MVEELNLSKLVSNIVVAKTYSNCRLCLAEIKEQYMRFEDSVTLDSENFQPLSEVLSQVLGLQDEVNVYTINLNEHSSVQYQSKSNKHS